MFTGPWSPERKAAVETYCEDMSVAVDCRDLDLVAGTGDTLGVGEKVIVGPPTQADEMTVKSELARTVIEPLALAPAGVADKTVPIALAKLDEPVEYGLGTTTRRKLAERAGMTDDDVLEIVVKTASEIVAGTTVGRARGEPLAHLTRLDYWAKEGYGPAEYRQDLRTPLVTAMESAVEACKTQRADPGKLKACALNQARSKILDALVRG
jgi:hypothetical protein